MRRARLSCRAAVSGLVGLCLAAGASTAAAASLHVSETPKTAHSGGTYRVTVSGRYRARELTGSAFLLGVIQYDGRPCLKTGKAEAKRTGFTFFLHETLASSPFKVKASFTTGSQKGQRRVCAYLYPRSVSPSDNVKPLAHAGAAFKVA
jgi:hypothetical protein